MPVSDFVDLHQWWIGTVSEPAGPFPVATVVAMLRQGGITAETLVCPVAGQTWQPVGAWPTFAGELKTISGAGVPRRRLRRQLLGPTGRALLSALRLVGLGILLGLLTGGALFAWWWFDH